MVKLIFFVMLMWQSQAICAKDLGVMGDVYPIAEADLEAVITTRLKWLEESGELKRHQKKLQAQAKQSIETPKGIRLPKATKDREFHYDPSIVVPKDLADHQGRVFHKKGERINPLDTIKLTKTWVFLDGEDPEQVEWAKQFDETTSKLILVNGSPSLLMATLEQRVFFDQDGILINKFKIENLPAQVVSCGQLLCVREKYIDL